MRKTHRHQLHLSFGAVVALLLAAVVLLPAPVPAATKSSSAPPAKTAGAGHLVIKRSANLGDTMVDLSIDGKEVARIRFNGTYDAPIAAGAHIVSALPFPNREHATASVVKLNVQPGKTYTYTALVEDVRIALR